MEEEKKEDLTTEQKEAKEVADKEAAKKALEEENKDKPDFKAKADAFYGKLKDSEEKVKELEEKLKAKEEGKTETLGETEKIAQVITAFSGLDKAEQERLTAEAKMKGISLLEAKKDEDFLLWKKAHNDKVEEEKKELTPSTKQDIVEGEKPLEDMTIDEKEKHFQDLGLIRKPKSYEKKWKK